MVGIGYYWLIVPLVLRACSVSFTHKPSGMPDNVPNTYRLTAYDLVSESPHILPSNDC